MGKQALLLSAGIVLLLSTLPDSAFCQAELDEHLKFFEPFIGKTWVGEFTGSTPEKPMVDVATWEVFLDGKAVRSRHSLNEGDYKGETIVVWDREQETLVYFYFTNAGFYTTGTMEISGNIVTSHEFVKGSEITEVKATAELLDDGRMHVKSMYLRGGEWVEGHEAFYVEQREVKE